MARKRYENPNPGTDDDGVLNSLLGAMGAARTEEERYQAWVWVLRLVAAGAITPASGVLLRELLF